MRFASRAQAALERGTVVVQGYSMRAFIGGSLISVALCGAAVAGEVHRYGPPAVVDVNRPRSPIECDQPIGINWYGSTRRCLAEMCAGHNVYNEYIFEGERRRKNPCYGQSPTNYPDD